MTANNANDRSYEIARTIFRQLAGSQRRLIAAVGAKDFVVLPDGIQFRIMRNAAKINHVSIRLHANDTYRLEFGTVRGVNYRQRELFTDVHVEQLRRLFETTTGLYLTIL
ncbi:hypothetical protein [Nocardia transvalensis]|uniref:hypothetical protein n=1 Tax=Nocardia transvalensis TaxID=37333 RepID=UPI001895211D|nr:hypothetical protein [Nocardia transvalensis]MBF6332395.1 hypothetical protein [Nocardia transvalensis]